MGRRRENLRHLPPRMQLRHGAYYHVTTAGGSQKWTRLAPASDYGAALRAWAEIEGRREQVGESVRDAVQAYLAHCASRVETGHLSQKTLTGYTGSTGPLLDVLGDCALRDVTDQEIRRYRSGRTTAKGKPAPIAANREIALLSASYGHAAELGWIPSAVNPCRHVKRNQERPRQRYITDAELAALLKHAPAWMQAAIRITVSTGMRVTDLLKLRLSDITEDGLTVQASKTGKRLIYEWTPELRAAVDHAKANRTGRVTGLYLFQGRTPGHPLTLSGLETTWDRVRTNAGLPDVQWRDWRRKAGSDTTEAHATELLDHSTSAVTRRHYRAAPKRVRPAK